MNSSKKRPNKIVITRSLVVSFIAFFSVFFASISTHAQSWYEIEIIIFEHTNTSASPELESWPSDLELEWPSPLLELDPAVSREESPTLVKPAFEELMRDERRLNNDAYAFRVRDPYRLLWHKAWRAPLLDEDKAPWILVQADEKIGDHYRLEGAIRIHLSRYLHLNSNLWLTEIAGPANIEAMGIGTTGSNNGNPLIQNNDALNTDTANNATNDSSENLAMDRLFDWSQLPKPVTARWACNYIEEIWPENERFLPNDYYQNPAPLEWYYPFGCKTNTPDSNEDTPMSISLTLSDQSGEAELRKHFPELFTGETVIEPGFSTFTGTDSNINAESTMTQMDNFMMPVTSETRYPVSSIIHISDSRRMRSSEVHYIDHPKIGILVVVHPVEKPSMEPALSE